MTKQNLVFTHRNLNACIEYYLTKCSGNWLELIKNLSVSVFITLSKRILIIL